MPTPTDGCKLREIFQSFHGVLRIEPEYGLTDYFKMQDAYFLPNVYQDSKKNSEDIPPFPCATKYAASLPLTESQQLRGVAGRRARSSVRAACIRTFGVISMYQRRSGKDPHELVVYETSPARFAQSWIISSGSDAALHGEVRTTHVLYFRHAVHRIYVLRFLGDA